MKPGSEIHTLWSKAVGTSDYDKQQWKRFGILIDNNNGTPQSCFDCFNYHTKCPIHDKETSND